MNMTHQPLSAIKVEKAIKDSLLLDEEEYYCITSDNKKAIWFGSNIKKNPMQFEYVHLPITSKKENKVQKIGDGRIIFEGKTYANEKSGRVIPIEVFTQSNKPDFMHILMKHLKDNHVVP